jgi:hypothetical protein
MNPVGRSRRTGLPKSRLDILVCGLLILFAAGPTGCDEGNADGTTPGYLPAWAEARQALDAALTAWRDAPSPLPPSLDSPTVKFVDKQRRPGQRLLSYEVLGRSEVENARQFTVRLRLEDADAPQLVRYNVLGRHPVWVFRLEDYDAISHWDMDMKP